MRRPWLFLAVAGLAASCGRSDPVKEHLQAADRLLQAWQRALETDTADRQRRQSATEEALSHAREAERLAPHYPLAKHRLGVCLSLLGRYGEAEAAFDAAERLAGPNELPTVLQDRALCALRQGQYDRALALFERVIELRPWQPDARYHMGLIYEQRGYLDRALDLYRAELDHSSSNAKAWQAYYRLKGEGPAQGRSLGGTFLWLGIWVAVVLAAGLYWLARHRRGENVSGTFFPSRLRGHIGDHRSGKKRT